MFTCQRKSFKIFNIHGAYKSVVEKLQIAVLINIEELKELRPTSEKHCEKSLINFKHTRKTNNKKEALTLLSFATFSFSCARMKTKQNM